jgi:broad specificity phosphatase PhoE
MKTVYLIRHGETEYNKDVLVQDGATKLSELGLEQAAVVAARVANLPFTHLVVSDFERTKQTAAPISEVSGVTPEYTPLFREVIRPSAFFHTPKASEAYQAYLAEERAAYNADNSDWRHSDEESFAMVKQRAQTALRHLQSLSGDAVVVSHTRFIRLLVATIIAGEELDGPLWLKVYDGFKASNTGITTIIFNEEKNRWQLLTFNDHAHFAE